MGPSQTYNFFTSKETIISENVIYGMGENNLK